MILLHLINHLKIGGRERLVVELANVQFKMGHKPFVVCLRNGGVLEQRLDPQINVVKLYKKTAIDLSVIKTLKGYLIENAVDVLHIHNPGTLLSGVLAGKLAKVKRIIVTEHGFAYDIDLRERWKNRVLYQFVDHAIAVSESVNQTIRRLYKIPNGKSIVIPNGICPLEIDEPKWISKKKLKMEDDYLHAVSIGRLVKVKNHENLIRALHIIKRSGHRVKLWIVGKGPMEAKYQRLIAQLNIQNDVILTGERSDVNRILNAADIFILPSFSEGLSITLLEAISAGVPVIVSKAGGNTEVIEHKKTGLWINPIDVEGIAAAIIEIAKSAELRETLVVNAKALFLRKFTIQQMAARIANLYNG